jgi:beta-1,4-mannosyl-glycoprotein beta-1,4-N-acetylglucosaminyltransferase
MDRNFKVIDTFIFFDELELLDLRFKELYDVVNRFVIVESKATFTNKPKELLFEKNKHQFSQYLDKVTYIKIEDPPLHENPWKNEEHQRDCIKEGLKDCQDNDIVILSDVDEIPNLRILDFNKLNVDVFVYRMDLYYYYVNTKQPRLWNGSIGIRYNKLKPITMEQLRKNRNRIPNIIRGGWHFSYLGGIAKIQKKIESYAETGTNNEKHNNREYLEKRIDDNRDYYFDQYNLQETNLKELKMPTQINSFIEKYPFFYKNKEQNFHASCVFITTNSKSRVKWMEIAEKSIWDCNTDLIDEFIMCVDMLGNKDEKGNNRELLEKEYYEQYSKKGWKVLFNNFENLPQNQRVGFKEAKNDFIFYCEDKVKVTHIPSLDCVRKMHLMYRFGAIMYNCHLNGKCNQKMKNGEEIKMKNARIGQDMYDEGRKEREQLMKYVNDEKNYLNVEGSIFLRKNISLCDDYLFTYPTVLLNKQMINQIYDYLSTNKKGINIEKGVGYAFVNLNLHNVFSLYNIINEIPPLVKNGEYNDTNLNKYACMRYRDNDDSMKPETISVKGRFFV